MPLFSMIVLTIMYCTTMCHKLCIVNVLCIKHKYMPVSVYSMNYYVFIFIVMCLTFLLQYLEPFLGLSVQVLQVLWPAALNENILLVVLRGPVVDGQPLLVFIPLRASCWDGGKRKCQETEKTNVTGLYDKKRFAVVSQKVCFKEKFLLHGPKTPHLLSLSTGTSLSSQDTNVNTHTNRLNRCPFGKTFISFTVNPLHLHLA